MVSGKGKGEGVLETADFRGGQAWDGRTHRRMREFSEQVQTGFQTRIRMRAGRGAVNDLCQRIHARMELLSLAEVAAQNRAIQRDDQLRHDRCETDEAAFRADCKAWEQVLV